MYSELLSKIDNLNNKLTEYGIFNDEKLTDALEKYYQIRLTFTSNFIEGYTYTEEETFRLIYKNEIANFKSPIETGAVRGHVLCYKYMISLQNDEYIEENDVLMFHKLLSGGLENNAIAGRYRDKDVRVGSQIFIPHFKVKNAMKNMFESLENLQDTMHVVLLAIKYHKDLIFIHPFMDGNGRIARLIMNTTLIQNKYLPIDIAPEYKDQYHESIRKTYNDSSVFTTFMLNQAINSYNYALNRIENGD
jgi:Fic family protein